MKKHKTEKPRNGRGDKSTNQLWVNPRSNLKAENRWGERNVSPSTGARFLELADIALGVKPQHYPKKKTATTAVGAEHTFRKTGPYSA
jgi:hypothetical protein